MALSKKKQIFRNILSVVFTLLVIASLAKLIVFRKSEVKKYYKARESRLGSIRKAKEKKEAISFSQERLGIVRQVWIDDTEIGRPREFYMEAPRAEIIAHVGSESQKSIELFHSPSGWMQEELYWEIQDIGKRVYPDLEATGQWLYEDKRLVEIEYYPQILGRQRVRYFTAAKAEWNLTTNEMTAHTVTFSVVDTFGHRPEKVIDPATIILQGTAENMTFFFTGEEHKAVASQGMKLKIGGALSK